MKKILATLLVAVMALSASAQMLQSRTLKKSESPTTWFVRIGMSIDNLTGLDKKEFNNEVRAVPKVGMDIDFGFFKPIAKSGAYWGMDLGIVTRGGMTKSPCQYEDTDKVTISSWALKYTPITIGYKYSITDDIKIDAHLGAYASYDFSQSISANCDRIDEDYWEDFFDNKYDIGIQAGAGCWWKNFNLDLSYQHGFVDYYDLMGRNSLKTSAFVIRLGYAF